MHFKQFTPRGAALGQELSAGAQRRAEFLARTQQQTRQMLDRFRVEQNRAEANRRKMAAERAEARHLFVRDLKSDVFALLSRFELHRQDMAADFANLARALRQTRGARRQQAPLRRRAAARRPESRHKAEVSNEHYC